MFESPGFTAIEPTARSANCVAADRALQSCRRWSSCRARRRPRSRCRRRWARRCRPTACRLGSFGSSSSDDVLLCSKRVETNCPRRFSRRGVAGSPDAAVRVGDPEAALPVARQFGSIATWRDAAAEVRRAGVVDGAVAVRVVEPLRVGRPERRPVALPPRGAPLDLLPVGERLLDGGGRNRVAGRCELEELVVRAAITLLRVRCPEARRSRSRRASPRVRARAPPFRTRGRRRGTPPPLISPPTATAASRSTKTPTTAIRRRMRRCWISIPRLGVVRYGIAPGCSVRVEARLEPRDDLRVDARPECCVASTRRRRSSSGMRSKKRYLSPDTRRNPSTARAP